MRLKLIGAVCVIIGCGSCGFILAAQHAARIHLFQNLISALNFMSSELQYRCTPLPQLCILAGKQNQGKIQQVLLLLAEELDAQISPDAQRCMAAALDRLGVVDRKLYAVLMELGKNLGRFDLEGQLSGLEHIRNLCCETLDQLQQGKEARIRSYQTLGLCAGAAIAILFV